MAGLVPSIHVGVRIAGPMRERELPSRRLRANGAPRRPTAQLSPNRCRQQFLEMGVELKPRLKPSTLLAAKREPRFEAGRHPVEKGPEFQRDRFARRIDDVDWQGLHLEALENQFESTRAPRGVHLV
jgi:hypothetical protein